MSENKQVATFYDVIDGAKHQFNEILKADDTGVDWERESVFAYQMLTKNSFIMDIAKKNPSAVKLAIINVAAIGLTLNPATHYAYLVPRAGEICLDISFRGLIKIATDSGSIKWCKAELVYQGDTFDYLGPTTMPLFKSADPFREESGTLTNLLGAFCIAETADSVILVEKMSITELTKIRDEASKAAKKGPWATYPGEMAKKCVIKRAQKTWPMTCRHERIQQAVEIVNESEGSEWAEAPHRFKPGEQVEIVERVRDCLTRGDDFGLIEVVEDYQESDEVQMKFWALFKSYERASMNALLDDSTVERKRITSGRPDLNEPVETPGL